MWAIEDVAKGAGKCAGARLLNARFQEVCWLEKECACNARGEPGDKVESWARLALAVGIVLCLLQSVGRKVVDNSQEDDFVFCTPFDMTRLVSGSQDHGVLAGRLRVCTRNVEAEYACRNVWRMRSRLAACKSSRALYFLHERLFFIHATS